MLLPGGQCLFRFPGSIHVCVGIQTIRVPVERERITFAVVELVSESRAANYNCRKRRARRRIEGGIEFVHGITSVGAVGLCYGQFNQFN